MNKKQLEKAQYLDWEISQLEQNIKDIDLIISEYDKFGSVITFKRNSDDFSKSFGTKKFNLKPKLLDILINIKNNEQKTLIELKEKFEKI